MPFNRFLARVSSIAALACVVALAGCGGGGGGSNGGGGGGVVPTPAPTFAPTSAPTPLFPNAVCSIATCSSYTFASYPAGIAVSLNGIAIGNTPVTVVPPTANVPQTVSFANGAYTTTIDQTNNGNKTVFYNQITDTGNVSMTGAQSSLRAAASNGPPMVVRRVTAHAHDGTIVPDALYVRYDSSRLSPSRGVSSIEADAGGAAGVDILRSIGSARGRVVRTTNGVDVGTLAARLSRDPAVSGVYPVHYRLASTTVTDMKPNDPEFLDCTSSHTTFTPCQWSFETIKATYAWSYTQGKAATVAIIDTGVDLSHPDLSPRIIYSASAINNVLTVGNGAAQDNDGHGTNVAGIAAATTNDMSGFAGVGNNTKILAYRIFPYGNSSGASTGDEAIAISDAIAQHADVINLSIGSGQYVGSTGFDQMEHDAVELAISSGVTVVAAAGNGDDTTGYSTIEYPGAYDGVISTGASALSDPIPGDFTHSSEFVAPYSDYGPGLSVVAPGGYASADPGTDVLHYIVNDYSSTATTLPCGIPPPGRVCGAKFNGTSQATPHVTGTVALIQSALREAGRQTLSPAAIKTLIEGTADNINDPHQGHGRLNALRAIEAALGVPASMTLSPSSPAQFVAFAYTNIGAYNAPPAIADVFYTKGVPVDSSGAFRLVDIDPTKTTTYHIGVWLDANGDGHVDIGDQFGAAAVTCSATAKCTVGTITVSTITVNPFALP